MTRMCDNGSHRFAEKFYHVHNLDGIIRVIFTQALHEAVALQGAGCRVQVRGARCRVQGAGCSVQGEAGMVSIVSRKVAGVVSIVPGAA